jgi:hypothetical protein
VYTIVSRDRLKSARLARDPWRFHEKKRWTTAASLWAEAQEQELRMPIVFGDANHCSRLIGWGVLTDLTVADDGTRSVITDVRTLPGNHGTQELILRSTRQRIAAGFIRPYAICATPSFLAK